MVQARNVYSFFSDVVVRRRYTVVVCEEEKKEKDVDLCFLFPYY